ncbi:dynamin family protein [Gordonia desulfuricans]|uniref:dynamin family protein n=1 Tax=Gordonia desulfuricans TaxID=89051 RepID=UPI000A9A9E8B|nr:dynamin family protein [Gordonia desulfuricans]
MDANTAKVVKIVDRLADMAGTAGREDLTARMAATRDRVTDPRARVVVVGQLKQGKSHLINALLNVPVCRVGDAETTSTITVIGHGEQPAARLVVADTDEHGGTTGTGRVIPLTMDDISRDLSRAPEAGGAQVLRVEVDIPSPLLQRGLVLVDTPGSGGVGSPHAAATLGLLSASTAIIVASDVSQEYTAPEMAFIRQATELSENALLVATKTDLYPMWREVGSVRRLRLRPAQPDAAAAQGLRGEDRCDRPRPDLGGTRREPAERGGRGGRRQLHLDPRAIPRTGRACRRILRRHR